jgi:hypothetical protein
VFQQPAAPAAQAPIPEADILPVDDVVLATPVVEQDPSAYQLAGSSPQAPVAIPEAEVIDDFFDKVLEENGYGPTGGQRRKKKKRKRQANTMSLEMSNMIISACVMSVLLLITVVILIFKPYSWPIIMAVGGAIFAVGQSWYVRSVMEDGIETALMVMFVPLYPLIYFIGNMERLGKQFAIRVAGMMILLAAFIAWQTHPTSPDDEEEGGNILRRPVPRIHQPPVSAPAPAPVAPPGKARPDDDPD